MRELAASTGGGDHLSSGDFVGGPLDIAGAATRLKIAAEAVADVGLKIAVEAFAWSAINSVPMARDLLARVGAPNAGHLLDVWHFYNTGSTAESIADLDVTTVAAVQLNDGPRVQKTSCGTPGTLGYYRERGISTSADSSRHSGRSAMTAPSASNRAIPSSDSSMWAKQPPGRSTQR